ncbi:phosphoribosylglycinamide formyltransferase [Alcanivorax marinus]|uniref:Phosphoribosylglycinamide formyltransferase n=1 Tax=Alloalcanivorax marinus TaxID=1177169 RepID=A0A9Q3YQN3_9GAMM|nr:phosphoribosylglycinamide formyltransferase [Alloalcanivorax marinus]MCC4307773.1 phosphoribosylglycinamide formyltransferase [Alloalcanivorax marinus]MCU5786564.1 phosphoribosylglycinamide formyltransferase [Alloalcanivorax marinus]
MTHRLAVLISGAGTNLQAILDHIAAGDLPATVSLVLSNRPAANGLAVARDAGVPVVVIDHRDYPDRETFDRAMIERIDAHGADTVVLAGFMRILSAPFVAHYRGRLINIHPSLLPRYPGLDTHARALAAGDAEHGCSLHFVTEQLDGGPLIARAAVPVHENDSVETLSKRVQQQEHRLYPLVLRWRAEGRLQLTDQGVELDGEPLPAEGLRVDATP